MYCINDIIEIYVAPDFHPGDIMNTYSISAWCQNEVGGMVLETFHVNAHNRQEAEQMCRDKATESDLLLLNFV